MMSFQNPEHWQEMADIIDTLKEERRVPLGLTLLHLNGQSEATIVRSSSSEQWKTLFLTLPLNADLPYVLRKVFGALETRFGLTPTKLSDLSAEMAFKYVQSAHPPSTP